jgi:hypothetical protein
MICKGIIYEKRGVGWRKGQRQLKLENLRRIEELGYLSCVWMSPKNEGVAFDGIKMFFTISDCNFFIFGNSLSPSK